jgi:ASCH domain.
MESLLEFVDKLYRDIETKCPEEFLAGYSFSVLTVKQPYATMLVSDAKRYEFRSWKLPEKHIGKWILIHAGKEVLKAKVKVSDSCYKFFDGYAKDKHLFGCIVGAVRFGTPELSDTPIFTGYRWPVLECFRFNEPIRDIRGQQGLWKITF